MYMKTWKSRSSSPIPSEPGSLVSVKINILQKGSPTVDPRISNDDSAVRKFQFLNFSFDASILDRNFLNQKDLLVVSISVLVWSKPLVCTQVTARIS